VKEVTDNFLCCYMVSGIEFPEAVDFAGEAANGIGVPILYSQPSDHKGGFFERLATFRRFPNIESTWCNRDLKVRPQKKVLERNFGKQTFYKLVGVRKFESNRRRGLYPANKLIRPDPEHSGSFLVFPLLHWTDDDVINYLKMAGLPTAGLYKRFGVSGCYWCPFYQVEIYKKVLRELPNIYDEFIEWETKLKAPSVIGEIYLRDLKKEVAACSR
jgi:3'-phosphoadenosine 5'-phosphosulfate sulfotransferase (PAPS reductase)/FAD synthetase